MTRLPWSSRVPMLSINPDAATADDVARLANERMDVWRTVARVVKEKTNCTAERANEIAKAVCEEIVKNSEVSDGRND